MHLYCEYFCTFAQCGSRLRRSFRIPIIANDQAFSICFYARVIVSKGNPRGTFLLLCRNFTLLEAWNILKRAHRRAQPNDGFARILLDLDRKLHGKVSMEWQQRKPVMKVCSICGKNAGLSSSSLKLHLQKSHKKLSSGSVDSAMTMEIQKALTALRISRSGSASPTGRRSHAVMDEE